MGVVLLFFAYLLGAYVLAAFLYAPFAGFLAATIPPDQFIGRGGMILAILGFWPFLKRLGLADATALGYGIPKAAFYRTLVWGLFWGIGILLCLALALLLLKVRVPTPSIGLEDLPRVATHGLLMGLAVALVEETFFRGALFAALRRHGGSASRAIAGSSLLYAVLHFFKPQPLPADAPLTITTVFGSLTSAFPALFQAQHLDALITLLLVGVLLALIRTRTGHLAWGLGLHAGWVLVIKVSHSYSDVDYAAPWVGLVASYDGMIGWLASAWIGLLIIIIAAWPHASE